MAEHITIFDTTLRDGEQAPGYSMNLEEKLRMARQLELLNVDVIEAGFAIASPGDFASVEAIAKTMRHCTVASLSRALKKDIDCAWEAVKQAQRPRIHTFIATSDLHLEYKLKMSRQQALDQVASMVRYARDLCPEVEFSAEDASRSDIDFLYDVIETAIESGASIINIPDTVGYGMPEEFGALIAKIMNNVVNIDKAILSVHCHNDLGLAVANTLAGLRSGARQAECTIGGIGERAGNAAVEEVVMAIRTRPDLYDFSYDLKTEELYPTSRLLSSITGVAVAPNKAIVGANAFAHESGIHQHGMMANSKTYEIMTPESIGLKKTTMVLGKHSGQHAFVRRMEELGYQLTTEMASKLFSDFKSVADKKKEITDRDLIAMMESGTQAAPKIYELVNFVVNSGNNMTATACVTLKRDDKRMQAVEMATGPVYACFKAVERIIKHPYVLEDYQLRAVTEHRDALGEVLVKISDENGVFRGRGVSTDVIEASMLGLLAAVNRMIEASEQNLSLPNQEGFLSAGAKAKSWVTLSQEALSRDMKVSGTVKEDVTKEL
ncbi:MAG: 2-isopropylmalate synthase [Sphaerochaetaceae bacterium]|jgi:2-isopropylmalate synthase|nr:2-isopropylmalate synthase [Sphaerochaetaceae bacterium]NLO59468.1 2-isopropylmalate synthase [Spirochaetales bacterium]MDD2405257.1 2-isopropylmalate synthase [Sphaerochaetaceae bacterium]MDD3670590.1 2-isopropylmalate synthase [Sphaerochaetaceae bacterium]MDD4259139.1 2-isopropylmalate synthase [Sphaerochaetaceae bacterium]